MQMNRTFTQLAFYFEHKYRKQQPNWPFCVHTNMFTLVHTSDLMSLSTLGLWCSVDEKNKEPGLCV